MAGPQNNSGDTEIFNLSSYEVNVNVQDRGGNQILQSDLKPGVAVTFSVDDLPNPSADGFRISVQLVSSDPNQRQSLPYDVDDLRDASIAIQNANQPNKIELSFFQSQNFGSGKSSSIQTISSLSSGETLSAGNPPDTGNASSTGAPGASGTGNPGASSTGAAGASSTGTSSASSTGAAGASSTGASGAPCYVTGTRLSTVRGEIEIESLQPGDIVITASGAYRPVRWIGKRIYLGLTAPQSDYPVRFKTGALADGMPTRDLLVSPDHCLWLDGLFVAAGHLVNGTSIIRGELVSDLTYWHVELDSHDLLLAENTPAESFLAAPGVRESFDGAQALDTDAMPKSYAPRAELGPELAALRGRLARRALSYGGAADPGPVRAWLDRCVVGLDGTLHVAGWAQDAAQPEALVCLDVMVDGAVVAFTVASEYRADLAAVGVGDGQVGFDLGVNVRLAAGVPHVVEIRRSTDGTLVCAKQIDATGAWTALLAA